MESTIDKKKTIVSELCVKHGIRIASKLINDIANLEEYDEIKISDLLGPTKVQKCKELPIYIYEEFMKLDIEREKVKEKRSLELILNSKDQLIKIKDDQILELQQLVNKRDHTINCHLEVIQKLIKSNEKVMEMQVKMMALGAQGAQGAPPPEPTPAPAPAPALGLAFRNTVAVKRDPSPEAKSAPAQAQAPKPAPAKASTASILISAHGENYKLTGKGTFSNKDYIKMCKASWSGNDTKFWIIPSSELEHIQEIFKENRVDYELV